MAFEATATTTTRNKRTRSQTTLDQFNFNPTASPLKQARSALKHATLAIEHPQSSPPPDLPPTSSNYPLNPHLPPSSHLRQDHHLKRPPSPTKDATLLHQPDFKRPRHTPFPPPKPSSPPDPSEISASSTSSPHRRAKSVPPVLSTIPLLDLNNVPPSPRRSPTKFRIASVPPEDLAGPSSELESIPTTSLLSLPPKSPTFTFTHAIPLPPTSNSNPDTSLAPESITTMSPLTPLPSSINLPTRVEPTLDLDPAPVPVPNSINPSLLFPQVSLPPLDSTPRPSASTALPDLTSRSLQASNITLPQPRNLLPRAGTVKSRMRPKPKAALMAASTSAAPAGTALPPRKVRNPRDRERNNLLGAGPRPVRSTSPPRPPTSRPSRAKSEAPEKARHTNGKIQSHPPPPSGHQPTQSLPIPRARISPAQPLRSQTPRAKTPSRPYSRAHSQPPRTTSRANSQPPKSPPRPSLKTPPLEPTHLPLGSVSDDAFGQLELPSTHPVAEENALRLIQPPPPQSPTQIAAKTLPMPVFQTPAESAPEMAIEQMSLPAQGVLSGLSSDSPLSSLESDPEEDTQHSQRSELKRELTPQLATLPSSRISSTLQLNSSLSELTHALDKLNARPPERPNTSLGFHRPVPGTLSEDESFSSDVGGGASKGVSTIRSEDKGKAVERPFVGTTMSTTTGPIVNATTAAKVQSKSSISAQSSSSTSITGSKKLRQTKLMLPPPPPVAGTRTTRLRAAAAAAATAASSTAAGSSSGTPARTPAKDGETLRQKMILPAPATTGIGASRPSTLSKPVFGFAKINPPTTTAGAITTTTTTVARRGGLSAMRGRFGMGRSRVTQRVSKASSLPVVIGSPVKGGGVREEATDTNTEELGAGTDAPIDGVFAEAMGEITTKYKIGAWLKSASKDVLRDLGHQDLDLDHEDSLADISSSGLSDANASRHATADENAKALVPVKEREVRRNASRRASMASHLLTQSLSALPDGSSAAGTGKDVKEKSRAVSSTYPAAAPISPASQSGTGDEKEKKMQEVAQPPPPRAHNTRLATGALSTPPNAYKQPSLREAAGTANGAAAGESAGAKGKGKEVAESPGTLAVLRDCRIFVDVRTDEGDDAGALFVDMLRGLGAKIANRVGSRCTHVVFKNGLMSTLTRYRLLGDPKPHVVGIAWVVECVEQRTKVDELRFLVNLENANIAGVNKRRRSMLPKHVSPVANKIARSPASSDSSQLAMGLRSTFAIGRNADRPTDISSPMAMDDDGDSSMRMLPHEPSAGAVDDEEASLPPLERARRRKSMLLGK